MVSVLCKELWNSLWNGSVAVFGPPFFVAQDLVDAIQDAEASKDWQAMRDAVAGWSLASISFYVIYVSIDPSIHPAIHTKLSVYKCMYAVCFVKMMGFIVSKATPNTRCYAQKNILAALRTEERPGIEHEAGSSWPTKDGNIMRSNRSFYPPQTSTFAYFCMIF